MGSIFYMERNGQKYAYESTSVRVPGRKNPKTIKRYLGKVDPETGKIIPKEPRRSPLEEYAKLYGPVLFLDGIQKELGIMDDLRSTFSTLASDIMGAAMALAIDPVPFDLLHYGLEGSVIRESLNARGAPPFCSVGELPEEVGSMKVTMDFFFSKRMERSSGDHILLDLVSSSSYRDAGGRTHFGHNGDPERTHFALVTDGNGIPVMFRMLPGPISETDIMEHAVDDIREMGCRCRAVMDHGFGSAKDVSALMDMGVDFAIPSDVKTEPMRKLMTRAVKELTSSSSFAYHDGASYKYVEYEVGIADLDDGSSEYVVQSPRGHKDSVKNDELFSKSKKLKAFVVYDPRKAARDIDIMMSAVNDAESELENTRHDDPEKVYAALSPFARRFLDYELDEHGLMHMVRKQNAFSFVDNRAGMSVILSSADTTWEQMMTSFDVLDRVGRVYRAYGTDLVGRRNVRGDLERSRGSFLIRFIALMLRAHIQNGLREHEQRTRSLGVKTDSVIGMTVDEVMLSLGTVFAIGNAGNWRVTTIPKNVREIFLAFGLEPPKPGPITLD